jgi:hypothetical protein
LCLTATEAIDKDLISSPVFVHELLKNHGTDVLVGDDIAMFAPSAAIDVAGFNRALFASANLIRHTIANRYQDID